MFIWTDFETTGLNPRFDIPLALGFIITDDSFKEVARREWVIRQPADSYPMLGMAPVVREMHTKNGLLDRVQSGTVPSRVASEACAFLDRVLGPADAIAKYRPPMAGNSVWFDAAFMREHFPAVAERFNYRLLDVSTLKVLAMATVPGAAAWNTSRPDAAHMPIADLEQSLAELAHWRRVLGGA